MSAAEGSVTSARRRGPQHSGGYHQLLDQLQKSPPAHRELVGHFVSQLQVRDPDGDLVANTGGGAQVAELALDRVLDSSLLWVRQLGAFYDVEGVRRLLGGDGAPVSRQAVHQRKGLLALATGSGKVVYPAVQFRGRRLAPGLEPVLQALPTDLVSRWTLASWLTSPELDLDRARPIDILHDGTETDRIRVHQVARRWATQLRS